MIAIHHRTGSFSDKWIEYCDKNNIRYKMVDCYASNIMEELSDCECLMWHWSHSDYKAALFARQLCNSLEQIGKKVFPNSASSWHFDDKVGQKYLLEAIDAPLVPGYIFYQKQDALSWADKCSFPKVFKLRGGAGAENVRIVRNKSEARKLINKCFSSGFKVKSRSYFLKERLWQFNRDRTVRSFLNISKGVLRLFIPKAAELNFPAEKNYAYFQDFIPGNDHDIRVIVIGDRAFAIKRLVRKGDFRASGSGRILYDPGFIPTECIKISFQTSELLGAQCLAYDFVFEDGSPLLVEISYSFARGGYLECPGYWTSQLKWVAGHFYPEYFMIQDMIGKRL